MKTIVVYLTIMVLFSTCTKNEQQDETPMQLTAQESGAALRAILDYLECEECTDEEMQKVVKLGETATPTLIRIMNEGPAPVKMAEAESAIRDNYRNLEDFETDHKSSSVSATEREFVSTYLENYKASFQIKAIKALVPIGGETANTALRDFQQTQIERDDVRRTIDIAVESIR